MSERAYIREEDLRSRQLGIELVEGIAGQQVQDSNNSINVFRTCLWFMMTDP